MKKKNKLKEKINIIQLLLPGLFIFINWLILRYATNNTLLLFLIVDTIIIIVLSFYNNNKFIYTFVALIIYSLINFIPYNSCSAGDSDMFPCMYEGLTMLIIYFWIILYLIIYGIRCIIKLKK